MRNTWVMHVQKHVGNAWAKTRGKCMGRNTWVMHGQKDVGNAWAKTRG